MQTSQYYFYSKDHLGNIRQVTEADGSSTGNVIQRNDYYPFGAELCDGTAVNNVQNRKYNGKEFDNMHGLNTYDYGARQYNPVTARWDRMDPLCEKYYSVSPYVYCMNNPVKFIDPDGRVCGDFYDENGNYLGNDGINDGKVYILKTSEKSFGEGANTVSGAGLSQSAAKATKDFIKTNNGNTEAFINDPIAYNNSIEIESSQSVRKSMVDHVSKDNGKGGQKDANNREYGGEIRPDGINFLQGDVFSPKINSYAFIEMNTSDYSTFHSHPSGYIFEYSKPPTSDKIYMENTTTTYLFTQSPSPIDIQTAGSRTHYVMGRSNGTTYIYNAGGVQATIPTKKFIKIP